MISPTTRKVADLLRAIGWDAPNDAQLAQLDKVIGDGRLIQALFEGERQVRDGAEAKLYCEQLMQWSERWNPESWDTGPLDPEEVARVGRNIREVFGLHSREAAMYAMLAAKPIKDE